MQYNNVNNTLPDSRYLKDYENVKLVKLLSSTAAQLPLILCMESKNSDFGVGGNIKFFAGMHFILMNTKFTNLNQKIIFKLSAFTPSWYMERFVRYDQICALSLVKIRKKKPKSKISLYQLLNIRNIQNLPLDICFCGWQMRCNLLKFLCASPKTSKSKMAPIMVKKSFSVLVKQQDTQIMKFNSHPYTLSLQYPSDSKFSQLLYESGCSHAFWCR